MHRALIIRLGEALEDDLVRLARECDAREASGFSNGVRARFVDAPPHAVGNLTNPVQVLRENLENELLAKLTDLLRMTPGASADFVLDVYLLVNLGEPLVANAATIVIDMLVAIVDANFRAIFPPHRTGALRRFRIVPIALLPAPGDCMRQRPDAIDELDVLHDAFVERHTQRPDFPVDRVFLLDAMTSRGIAPLSDLAAQVANFLRLVLFGDVRRSVDFVQLLESECNDLFGTFGVATCEVDFLMVRDTLSKRMAARAAEVLGAPGDCALMSASELLPRATLEDADARDRAIEELRALPLRTLQVEGSGAARPLAALYDELLQRMDGWRTAALEESVSNDASGPQEETAVSDSGWSLPVWAGGSALLLGGLVFAVAHFALLVTLTMSLATAGGFAVAAFILVAIVLRSSTSPASEEPSARSNAASEKEDPAVLFDVLRSEVEAQRTRLHGLCACFDAIAAAVDTLPPEETSTARPGPFRASLVSRELLQTLYDRRATDDGARGLADRFLRDVGSWEDILTGRATPGADALDVFCREHFAELGGHPLFAEADHRTCVSDTLERFLETWKQGMPAFLEGDSRKQFDPDGFRVVFSSCVFAPTELTTDVSAIARDGGSLLDVRAQPCRLDDVFVLSAVVDVHPDAVAPLADRRNFKT